MFVDYRCVRCLHPLRALARHEGVSLCCPHCSAAVVVPRRGGATAEVTVQPAPPRTVEVAESRPPADRLLLPWLLLTPAALALMLWQWMGHGVLWAGLGVALGGAFLLLSQRGRWPMPLRIGVSLSLALLGHGLTLASPSNADSAHVPSTMLSEAPTVLSIPDPRFPKETERITPISAGGEVENLLLTRLRSETASRPVSIDLKIAARIGDLLAATTAGETNGKGRAVIATREGTIKEFSIPDFRLRAESRLDGVAYRLALDGRHKRLWAAVCEAGDLKANRHGDRPLGRADLHVYEIPATANARPRPARVLPIGGDILELLLAPDETALFYLARDGDGAHLGRIDAARQTLDCRIALPDGTQALCRTADGRTLYAAGGGRVHVLDPATLRTRRVVEVNIDAVSVAADNEGRVYLSERGPWTNLARLDLRGERPAVHQWSARLHGCIYLKLSPDQYRLYTGTSSVISDGLNSLLVRGHSWETPLMTAVALSSPTAPVQGEFFLAPDGRYLINRWGCVYHLARGEAKLQFERGAAPAGAR